MFYNSLYRLLSTVAWTTAMRYWLEQLMDRLDDFRLSRMLLLAYSVQSSTPWPCLANTTQPSLATSTTTSHKSAVIAWKCVNGVAPTYLWGSVSQWRMSVVDHVYGLRQLAACISLPRVQTSTEQRSFAYSGPAVWNIPPALREHMSLAAFKSKLKTYSDVHSDSWWPPGTVAAFFRDFGAMI